MKTEITPGVSPSREVRNIDTRLELLRARTPPGAPDGDDNRREIDRLEASRAYWMGELEANRRAHVEHAKRMGRLHADLAAGHHRRLRELQRDTEVENG